MRVAWIVLGVTRRSTPRGRPRTRRRCFVATCFPSRQHSGLGALTAARTGRPTMELAGPGQCTRTMAATDQRGYGPKPAPATRIVRLVVLGARHAHLIARQLRATRGAMRAPTCSILAARGRPGLRRTSGDGANISFGFQPAAGSLRDPVPERCFGPALQAAAAGRDCRTGRRARPGTCRRPPQSAERLKRVRKPARGRRLRHELRNLPRCRRSSRHAG